MGLEKVGVDLVHNTLSENKTVLNLGLFEFSLFELVLPQSFQYIQRTHQCSSNDSVKNRLSSMYTHVSFHDKILKYILYHCLNGGWAVGETKEHDKGLK
jgi:hypothetical protein